MAWTDQIFRYCERGADPSFWAEPLNAVSNGAFIIAAGLAARLYMKDRARGPRLWEAGLIVTLFVIGVGSFLFHTTATRWASYADTLPIGVFMLAYLGYALRRFVGWGWLMCGLGLAAFVAALTLAGDVKCRTGLLSVIEAARGPCLNGTPGYFPAFLAMVGIGAGLAMQRHPAAKPILTAGGVFFLSMLARTIDWEVCTALQFFGRAVGSHFVWHLLNALTLYILIGAAIRHGAARSEHERLIDNSAGARSEGRTARTRA